MTPYDMAMAGVIIAGMVWGAIRGITWQVASIASLVLGYLFAHPLSASLAPHFPGEPVVARALAMLAVYVAVSGGVFFGAWLVRTTLSRMKFEAYDRHLGMLLGGLEGALLGIVVTLFVASFAPQTRGPIFQSPSGKVVGRLMDAVGPVLPAEVRSAITPFWPHHADPEWVAGRDEEDDRGWDRNRSRTLEIGRGPADDRRWDGTPQDGRRRGSRASEEPREERKPIWGRSRDDRRASDDEGDGLIGRAGEALEESIETGDTSSFKELYQEGKSRFGKAAGDALERKIKQLGEELDERAPRDR
jgi:uncharacterized membrane protein required for colicin V production